MRKRFDRDFAKYGMNCTQKACLEVIMSYKEEGIDIHHTELQEKIKYGGVFFDGFLSTMKSEGFLSWEVKIVPGENNFQMVWDLGPLYETLKNEPPEHEEDFEI